LCIWPVIPLHGTHPSLVAIISTDQVAIISTDQVAVISTDQVAVISTDQVAIISTDQVAVISTDQVAVISTNQVAIKFISTLVIISFKLQTLPLSLNQCKFNPLTETANKNVV